MNQHQQNKEKENTNDTDGTTEKHLPNQTVLYSNIIPESKRPRNISLGALLDMPIPKRGYIIHPWLRQRESAMIYAAPGVGKSLFALSLALAVAGGGKALGRWPAPKPRRVLYVDGEMPIDDIQARAKMLLPATGGDLEAVRRNLHFQARQHQRGDSIFTDLSDERSRETLLYQSRRGNIELLILDNLSTLATVDDENAAGEFNDTVKFLLRMKQEGIACVLVHHSNKTGESYRGSSKIATTFEVILRMEDDALKATDRPDTTRFRLSWNKFRGRKEDGTGVPLDFALEQAIFDNPQNGVAAGQLQWISSLAEDTRVEQLLELVRTGEYGSQKDLASALGVSVGTVNAWKTKAITQGRITTTEWAEHLPGTSGRKGRGKAVEPAETADF